MSKISEKIGNLREKNSELGKEVKEKTLGYILTSFGLVAGLAWNDAVKAFIERFFPDPGNGVKAKFAYAVVLTILVVVVSLYLSSVLKIEKKVKVEEKKKN